MTSVTGRISEIKQPWGGYIRPSEFDIVIMNDGILLNAQENIHGSVIGMAVDYFTRFLMGADINDAFMFSITGARMAEAMGMKNAVSVVGKLLQGINGLDDKSVINACKAVTFDVWYRNPIQAIGARGYKDTNPDKATIENIQTFVKRSLTFFEKYGPVTKDGFSFEPKKTNIKAYEKMLKTRKGSYGGYTYTVDSGDGDFLTADTLWDFKVTKSKPTSKHTLQLLMYWIMGQHSGQDIFKNIKKIGIFNLRLNIVYLYDMSKVSPYIIKTVEEKIICY